MSTEFISNAFRIHEEPPSLISVSGNMRPSRGRVCVTEIGCETAKNCKDCVTYND